MKTTNAAAAALLLLAACEPKTLSTPVADDAAPPRDPSTQTPDTRASQQSQPTPPSPGPRPSDQEVGALAKANNKLSFALYAKIKDRPGSLAFSPWSAETALTMTAVGARGETLAQLQKLLGFQGRAEDAADVGHRFATSFGGPITVRVANRLFGERSYAFEKSFLDASLRTSGAPLEALDFKGATDASRTHINDWVSDQTNARIKDLLPEGTLDARTRLVLVNASYFKGDWEHPFKKEATYDEAFHVAPTTEHRVPTMHQELTAGYAEIGDARVLDLPYQGGELTMTFVLPNAADGLAKLEGSLDADGFDRMIGAEKPTDVAVSLPKLTIDPKSPIALGDALQALGVTDLFDRATADLSGIAKPANPDDRLYVSKVLQKTFVKLDEKGTEAAAATAVVAAIAGAEAPTTQPKAFKADHPFLFFLRDKRSNAILFAGRVSDPAAT